MNPSSARAPRILLRSSWQVVNIGDIAHTPGLLALIERWIPEAEVTLWASPDITPEVIAMERGRFPRLRVVHGRLETDGSTADAALAEAMDAADFLLHGSGPSLVGGRDVAAFVARTGKPFGVYGITYAGREGGVDAATVELLGRARFVYFRDSLSLAAAQRDGFAAPVIGFAPDAAFAVDLRDDALADRYLAGNGLVPGGFLCCIPRLRFTPYWLISGDRRQFDPAKDARNRERADADHAPLREAITAIVRGTRMRILLCPEDRTQMAVGRDHVLDRLPTDVRDGVVWREDFWLTDEAVSVYRRSAGLFGNEMHSPIMCVGNGIPAIVCRWQEQTTKGLMWRDIGLEGWLFDLDDGRAAVQVPSTAMAMAMDPGGSAEVAAAARERVAGWQRETMAVVREEVLAALR